MHDRSRHVIIGLIILPTLLFATSIAHVRGVESSWGVTPGDSWTWEIHQAAWDDPGDPSWIGRQATVSITTMENDSTWTWLKGNVTALDVQGNVDFSETDLLLGNVSIADGLNLDLYLNGSAFILPAIIPLPASQSFSLFSKLVNATLQDILDEFAAEIPVSIDDDYTVGTTENGWMITFSVSGSIEGYTLNENALEFLVEFDDHGVAERFKATATGIQFGEVLVSVVLFEIVRTDVEGSPVPGYTVVAVLVLVPVAIAVIARRIGKQKRA